MSKSLKNFISVNDYMNSKITKSPGDDFRIYCLQYKYHASLTYSIDRIYEAEIYRKKIENFIFHMKSILILSSYQSIVNNNKINNNNNNNNKYSNGVSDNSSDSSSDNNNNYSDSNKPTVESKKMMNMFFQTSIAIDNAFRDDFDTPKVLNLLSQLISECYLYSQLITLSSSSSSSSKLSRDDVVGANYNDSRNYNNNNTININHNHSDNIHHHHHQYQQQQPIQPIITICTYIGDLLTMLGLQFPSKINASKLHEVFFNHHHHHHQSGSSSSSSRIDSNLDENSSYDNDNTSINTTNSSSSSSGDRYQITASDIDMILQFRANIRNTIVKNLKSIKEKRKLSQVGSNNNINTSNSNINNNSNNNMNITQMDIDNEHSYQYLLKQCDHSREQISQIFNIKIEDINNNYSTWRPLD